MSDDAKKQNPPEAKDNSKPEISEAELKQIAGHGLAGESQGTRHE
jgi:hypothetical protein